MTVPRKRLVLCCDGTWMDSGDAYTKPSANNPQAKLQTPSNVTRICRALSKVGRDGVNQIIYYHAGVGTSPGVMSSLTGALGKGISEHVREAYSFIATNYTSGDEIILVGFSRGAFTARSVAGMIENIGLLTRAGMDSFYAIFKDQENFRTPEYEDMFPNIPFSNKPKGPHKAREYKNRLEDLGLTRVYDANDFRICVTAIAVWDTVGSLGIPSVPILSVVGSSQSTHEYKFYNTNLNGTVKHAFQALALDEQRKTFRPAVWERKSMDKTDRCDLRQVWFPGAHSNIGGGYDDQGMANISLAWMMDQLASIGVTFLDEYIGIIFKENVAYYEEAAQKPLSLFSGGHRKPWAIKSIYEKHKPIRPWGLGEIYNSTSGIYSLAGKQYRTPGFNVRSDPDSGQPTNSLLENTNERIHSSVRIRLELEGLGPDDNGLYKCPALLDESIWRLRHVRMRVNDPIPHGSTWGAGTPPTRSPETDLRWIWEYCGPEEFAPKQRYMIEEKLGPYERLLLSMNKLRPTSSSKRRKKRRKDDSTSTTIQSGTTNTQVESDNSRDSYDRGTRVTPPLSRVSTSGGYHVHYDEESLLEGPKAMERRRSILIGGDKERRSSENVMSIISEKHRPGSTRSGHSRSSRSSRKRSSSYLGSQVKDKRLSYVSDKARRISYVDIDESRNSYFDDKRISYIDDKRSSYSDEKRNSWSDKERERERDRRRAEYLGLEEKERRRSPRSERSTLPLKYSEYHKEKRH
ncbi:hypothetical protein HYFRA_00004392 [Hymenoscyphus fraxineus]|uniref:T6SS Phospholipase effector Tle1-like catalytic domain-containing protein n=1 Tax=Hymenoscyphus fraxineus TaxID=746836 RepID=A0A9N9KYL0_9HELO|nr:hypothetical protein HYFRA_00004392 [Hymenoscyphus fraxineus]